MTIHIQFPTALSVEVSSIVMAAIVVESVENVFSVFQKNFGCFWREKLKTAVIFDSTLHY